MFSHCQPGQAVPWSTADLGNNWAIDNTTFTGRGAGSRRRGGVGCCLKLYVRSTWFCMYIPSRSGIGKFREKAGRQYCKW